MFIGMSVTDFVKIRKMARGFSEMMDRCGLDAPVISWEQDTVEVPIAATQEQLCAGLTETDPEDGDVTGQILVTNISNFVAERTRNISYAVFDSNEQLGEFTRKVVYTDYTSPQFSISEPLEIRMGDEVKILDKLEAKDVIDGDISNRILILNSDVNTATPGKYDVTVQVSNGCGCWGWASCVRLSRQCTQR